MNIKDYENKISNFSMDFEGLQESIFQMINSEIVMRFDNEIDPAGKKWADIKYYNKERNIFRDSKNGSAKILDDTGLMKKAFQNKKQGKILTIYNAQNYFAKHQLGKSVKQRQMLDTEGVNRNEQIGIKEVISDWLENIAKNLFN